MPRYVTLCLLTVGHGLICDRSLGTCTRCPLEINLTESVECKGIWVCKVWLHKKYMQIDKPPAGSRARPLGPWAPQEPEDFLFATIRSKEEVGEVLYWAQLATLNPGQAYEKYTPGANAYTPHTFTTKFSPNVVRLDVGILASLLALIKLTLFRYQVRVYRIRHSMICLESLTSPRSYVALPPLNILLRLTYSLTQEEERYLVKLVKNLVKEYIKADNCINLLALAMTDDAANSSAMGIIKEIGAQNRTIGTSDYHRLVIRRANPHQGVLTKPDRVQRGESFEQWKMMLSGDKYAVKHGYYVVKNPGQGSLDQGIDHSQARAEEAEYFTGNEPWRSELSTYSERFGTAQLQTALSQKLTAQILTRYVEPLLLNLCNTDQGPVQAYPAYTSKSGGKPNP